jgi:hypothetical protein
MRLCGVLLLTSRPIGICPVLFAQINKVDKKQTACRHRHYYQAIKKARRSGRIGKTKQHRHVIS